MRWKSVFAALLCMLVLVACGRTGPMQTPGESGESPQLSATQAPIVPQNLQMCTALAGGGVSTADGYYYTNLRPDGNLNIQYLDYATHSNITLCNQPNCTHDSDTCNSFIRSNGLVPSLVIVNNKLLIIGGGINTADPAPEDFPYIDSVELNGANRSRLYQASAAAELGALLCDDNNFYTIERKVENENDVPTLAQNFVQIELRTGKRNELAELGADIIYVCDANGSNIYYYSIKPKEGSESFSDVVVDYYKYDAQTQEISLIDSVASDTGKAVTILNGKIYTVDYNAHQVSEKNLSDGSEKVITDRYPADDSVAGCSIRYIVDGKIIVDEQHNDTEGNAQTATKVVDCATGSVQNWPLFYNSSVSITPLQVEILAEQDDCFLVCCGQETLDVDYGDAETYTMMNSQYATISKEDFWNGTENYTYFSR